MAIQKKLTVALSMLACSFAMAQAPLGTITNVQGVVTATQGATSTTVTPGLVVTNGTRFVTTSGASFTMRLNTGCTVTVQPGQAVTVLQSMSCQELAASVRPVVVQAGPIAPNPALINGLVIAAGAAVVVLGVREITRNDRSNISPN